MFFLYLNLFLINIKLIEYLKELFLYILLNIEALHSEIVISILNHKISIIFHKLKKYDSHLIMQEQAKFNIKINVVPNKLEKYISLYIS